MKIAKGALTTILLFQLVLFFTFDSFAKNSRASNSANRLKLCAGESGDIRVKNRCSSSEVEVSIPYLESLNAFQGELVTPSGIVIQSSENSVSVIAGESTLEIDPVSGISITSAQDISINANGALNLHGSTVKISSETSTEVSSNIETTVKASGLTSVRSSGVTEVKGALVKIN